MEKSNLNKNKKLSIIYYYNKEEKMLKNANEVLKPILLPILSLLILSFFRILHYNMACHNLLRLQQELQVN